MGVVDTARDIEALSEQVESLSRECVMVASDTTWECPRGRRAVSRVAELTAITRTIGGDLREIARRLRAELVA